MSTVKKLIAMIAIVATLALSPACKKCKDCMAYNPISGEYDGGKSEYCGDDLEDAEDAKIPGTDIDAYDCDFDV